jgi:hypothetical protein
MSRTTTVAAAMFAVAQGMLPLCLCSVATAGTVKAHCCKTACCASKHCSHWSRQCCCDPSEVSSYASTCTCIATYPSNFAPVFDASSRLEWPQAPSTPPLALTSDVGLHGADWETAFDLMADRGPPGMRLHALFSVWRN